VTTQHDVPEAALAAGGDLRIAIGRVGRRLRQLYATNDPTFSEISVLSRLKADGAATPSALAAAEHVRPQAMGATLSALERRGLVERSPDPSDRRKVLVEITTAGWESLVARDLGVSQRMARALADGFTPAEQRQLAAAVPLLERLAWLL
jgi:DNA-binding MarR family transcriptional regulator